MIESFSKQSAFDVYWLFPFSSDDFLSLPKYNLDMAF